MKEGASNCVERHLNLNDCDTSLYGHILKWGISGVFIANALHLARCTQACVSVYTAWR